MPADYGAWNKQVENRNFLSPIGFKMQLEGYPKVVYFSQSASIPGLSMNTVEQPNIMGRPIPWEAHGLNYEPFNITFLVDEDLENYLILHNWMRGLGVPENFSERQEFIDSNESKNTAKALGEDLIFADGTLTVLNSNFQPIYNVLFKNLKPVELSTLEFDGTLSDQEYFQAIASFDYLSYEIQSLSGDRKKNLK